MGLNLQTLFAPKAPVEEPFWIDEPNPYLQPKANSPESEIGIRLVLRFISTWRLLMAILWLFMTILWILLFGWLLSILIGKVAGWLYGIIIIAMIGLLFFGWRRRKRRIHNNAEIQQRAKEISGAANIGSALHTAGHPLLQVDQPVVLALSGEALKIYNYQQAIPLDTIALSDIQSVDLVTYDDEWVPHVGVVDNTAQALQLRFLWQGKPCTCCFRRMYKVRAVGWYQAIQAAKLGQ